MLSAEPAGITALGIVTVIGIALCFFGYALAGELLRWLGWVVGAVGGAVVWWVRSSHSLSVSVTGSQAGELLLLLGVGAVAGRVLLPLFSRFAVVVAGFVATGGSVFVLTTGSRLTTTLASNLETRPTAVVSRLARQPELQVQQLQKYVLVALVAGGLGALLALKFYELIVTAAASSVGAALLANVVPLWQQALSGGVSLERGFGQVSPVWFGVALVLGLGFQLHFYREALDVPLSDGDEAEPLE